MKNWILSREYLGSRFNKENKFESKNQYVDISLNPIGVYAPKETFDPHRNDKKSYFLCGIVTRYIMSEVY